MQALEIAARIRAGEVSAVQVVDAALAAIERRNPAINCFIEVTAGRAREEARAVDALRSKGRTLPPLAGVPYAVKDLFDVKGLSTIAGSALHRNSPPATADAALVARMRDAGAILVGTLNMDAYAYGFTTENTAFGPTRNPHDPSRVAGGSSGGSGAAVAAGLVPLSLGSDTNGSIRVPASLCGIFGLKPTYGRLPRSGSYPFVDSLDHLGPFATTTADLAVCYNALQGPDAGDPACAQRPVDPVSHRGEGPPLRVARLGGYFDRYASAEARAASMRAAECLGATAEIELPEVQRARAAAFIITASEGGERHLETLKKHYADFEPLSRDRFLAGALTPAGWYLKAQRLRGWFRSRMVEIFSRYDVLVAPATPVSAMPIGAEWIELGGEKLPLRASMGLFTQPISFIGLPVVAAPIAVPGLPIGVQLIAPPWREDLCFAAAAKLELAGVARSRITEA
ncbi:MAG: AtzE family amidohydrolase [Candidatus Parcubacteria bacterium]|nr:AtzE family amidohydrolase [Burkholderiales bacterium]